MDARLAQEFFKLRNALAKEIEAIHVAEEDALELAEALMAKYSINFYKDSK